MTDSWQRDPEARALIRHFAYAHLPPNLADISRPICTLAWQLYEILPDGPELVFGLRQLLLAKDAFVRSALPVPTDE
jgi:hypothetical protein